MSPPTAEEQDAALAAMIGAVADGQPVTALDKAMIRLKVITQAKERLSWAAIGSVYGLSGKEMKREAHNLRVRVQRELRAAGARQDGLVPPRRGPARTPKRGTPPPPRTTVAGWSDEAAAFAEPGCGPYVHEFTGPPPEEWTYDEYRPYTVTGPGVVTAED